MIPNHLNHLHDAPRKEEDTVNHLFLQSEVVVGILSHFLGRCWVDWCHRENIVDMAVFDRRMV